MARPSKAPAPPELTIRMKKGADGSAVLTCVRADGTTTWQRQDGRLGQFFPRHDLTHFAVETVLEHRRGFYGLVADGWNIGDFGAPWPRGPMPKDMDPSELTVGFFDTERVFAQWDAVAPGDTLELTFDRRAMTA